jgi:hypothetical protein
MNKQFTSQLRAAIVTRLEKLYTPKLTAAQLSRIVLYECINCSAETGFQIDKLEIKREDWKDHTIPRPDDSFRLSVIVNDLLWVEFKTKVKEVANA